MHEIMNTNEVLFVFDETSEFDVFSGITDKQTSARGRSEVGLRKGTYVFPIR